MTQTVKKLYLDHRERQGLSDKKSKKDQHAEYALPQGCGLSSTGIIHQCFRLQERLFQ